MVCLRFYFEIFPRKFPHENSNPLVILIHPVHPHTPVIPNRISQILPTLTQLTTSHFISLPKLARTFPKPEICQDQFSIPTTTGYNFTLCRIIINHFDLRNWEFCHKFIPIHGKISFVVFPIVPFNSYQSANRILCEFVRKNSAIICSHDKFLGVDVRYRARRKTSFIHKFFVLHVRVRFLTKKIINSTVAHKISIIHVLCGCSVPKILGILGSRHSYAQDYHIVFVIYRSNKLVISKTKFPRLNNILLRICVKISAKI